jgi:Mn-dependent DtxR family transcriptional regulator
MKRVLIPSGLWKAVEKIAREEKHLGYTSGQELLRDLLRRHLMEYQFLKRHLRADEGEDDGDDGPLALEGYQ